MDNFIVLVLLGCLSPLIEAGYSDYLASLSKYSYCKVGECCQVDPDLYILNKVPDFHRVFGQHVAVLEIQRSLGAFYKRQDRTKPLVLSFHGTPGTGKNYAAEQIVEARYKYGKESKYVHGYSGRVNFPRNDLAEQYSEQLRNEILSQVKSCPHQTFIFDEVDKMPPGVFESIVGLLDHTHFMKNVDLSKSLFIFISNLGGVEIAKQLSFLMRKEGLSREETLLLHFEKLIETAAYNYEGGFKNSEVIAKAVIDLVIPFLPLEMAHVKLCIERLIALVTTTRQDKLVEKILKTVAYEEETNVFAASGCKKLEARVNGHLHSEL